MNEKFSRPFTAEEVNILKEGVVANIRHKLDEWQKEMERMGCKVKITIGEITLEIVEQPPASADKQ